MGRPRRTNHIDRKTEFGRKTMLCVWWDQKGMVYYELLKPGETVNIKRYQQQLIDLNHSLLKKRPERGNTRSFFSMTMLHHIRQNQFGTVGSTQLGSSIPCDLLTRLGSFRLPLVCINGSRIC